jgi:hypothetical protein
MLERNYQKTHGSLQLFIENKGMSGFELESPEQQPNELIKELDNHFKS